MSNRMAIFFVFVLGNGISLYSSEAVRAIAEADALARKVYEERTAEIDAKKVKLMLKMDQDALKKKELERELAWLEVGAANAAARTDQKRS